MLWLSKAFQVTFTKSQPSLWSSHSYPALFLVCFILCGTLSAWTIVWHNKNLLMNN